MGRHKPFYLTIELHRNTSIHNPGNSAQAISANGVLFGNFRPRVFLKLFQAKRDTAIFVVNLDNFNVDLIAFFQATSLDRTGWKLNRK